jgi:hypothetical protein
MAFVDTGAVFTGAPASSQAFLDANDYARAGDMKGAAYSVAIMILGAVLFLTVLRRSGFRAMVAVGRG